MRLSLDLSLQHKFTLNHVQLMDLLPILATELKCTSLGYKCIHCHNNMYWKSTLYCKNVWMLSLILCQ